jgi:hypothetical protein
VARSFNGTTDKITTGLGAAGGIVGAATVAVIIKSNSDTQATGVFHLGAGVSGAARLGIGISATKQYYRISGSTPSSATIGQTVADGWGLQAWCRAAGAAQVVRQHSYIYGTNTWAHADNATTSGNPSAPITSCTIGAEVTAAFWNGDIAAIVVFDRKLTDQEIESLAWSVTTWHTLAPKILWLLDQSAIAQLVNDFTGGGAVQSAISGTSVSASSVPVFNISDGVWIPTIVKPAAGFNTYAKDGSVLAGALVSGADVFASSETGSLISQAIESGADAAIFSETGLLRALGLISGADVFNPAELGSLVAGTILSGADVFSPAETGSLLAGALESGADVFSPSETGSLLTRAIPSGADSFNPAETGALLAAVLLSGADAAQHAETGSLALSGLLSGADAASFVETGALILGGLLSGPGTKTKDKTGSIFAGTISSGADAIAYTESGSILSRGLISGADAHVAVKTGVVVAAGQVYGADVYTAVETGSLLAVGNLSAFDATQFTEAGSLLANVILAGIGQVITGLFLTGDEIHLLTSAKVEQGRITFAGSESAVLVVTIPGKAILKRVDS